MRKLARVAMKSCSSCRNLRLLEQAGAKLVPFSPLTDPLPPDISGLYLGGGFPEQHTLQLGENQVAMAGVKAFAEAGGVVYAECGGLIYLSQSIQPLNCLPASMGKDSAQKFLTESPCRSGFFLSLLVNHSRLCAIALQSI